jgi:type IV secretion system protein VirD4
MIDNSDFRFGSAGFASRRDISRAGMFTQKGNSLFVGFHGKRPIFYDGMGGLLLIGGARSGKLRDVLAYNICAGIHPSTMLILDQKAELACISRDQTPDHKFCIYWNPVFLQNLPTHRINPVDYVRADSPTLVLDTKVLCENTIVTSGSRDGGYFEGRGREFLEGVILTLVKLNGILTLPDLYRVINLIPGGGDGWLNFAFEMSQAGFEISARVEEEIAASRNDSSGGFKGIIGEILKSFSCLSDPNLLASVSPPFNFSLKDLCSSSQTYNFYMCVPSEFIEAWSPVVKAMLVGAMLYKSRAPSAPQQTWLLDECAQLKKFPLLPKTFTYGAGIGIRPLGVYQSRKQMADTAENAEDIIASSAQLQSYFGVRDYPTAKALSDMIGEETLYYEDEMRVARAAHAKRQAMVSMMNGGDPLQAAVQIRNAKAELAMPSVQKRALRTPDEILRMEADKQFIFTDNVPKPIYADRKPYYEQRFMAGRYHPNPYYPPADKVRVKTFWGREWRRLVQEPVPSEFAHYPQYEDGTWSKVRP